MAVRKLTFYTAKDQKKLIRQFHQTMQAIRPLLVEKIGQTEAEFFLQDTHKTFIDEIMPEIPYIGGKSNPYTGYLQQTAMALAVYRTVKKRDGTLEDAAELIYKGMLALVGKMFKPFLLLYGWWTNSKYNYARLRNEAKTSQLRRYPQDWVYEFVEGNPSKFDYGIDMHECGILKYLQSQGAAELTPYLCAVDYITMHAMGIELRRTEIVVGGCKRCDFRFNLGGQPVKPGWPPPSLEKPCQ